MRFISKCRAVVLSRVNLLSNLVLSNKEYLGKSAVFHIYCFNINFFSACKIKDVTSSVIRHDTNIPVNPGIALDLRFYTFKEKTFNFLPHKKKIT